MVLKTPDVSWAHGRPTVQGGSLGCSSSKNTLSSCPVSPGRTHWDASLQERECLKRWFCPAEAASASSLEPSRLGHDVVLSKVASPCSQEVKTSLPN